MLRPRRNRGALTLSEHNWGPGASGWLTWIGDDSAGALAASLAAPGNAASGAGRSTSTTR